VDYLLKPVRSERLSRALTRIQEARTQNQARQGPAPRSGKRFPVKAGGGTVLLDLGKTTHFEVVEEIVWAHAGSQSFQTNWTSLASVEARFPDVPLLRIHRHLLVRQDAIVGVRTARGGRLLVLLPGGVELESSRPSAARIRAELGLKEG
jgi:two-component system LytT family response regulator/two-component system response regulator AlgR